MWDIKSASRGTRTLDPRIFVPVLSLFSLSVQNGILETIREIFLLNHLKQNPLLTLGNKDVAIEVYLSCLEEKLLKIEVPKDKFNNVTKGERDALYNLKNDKTIVIKGADKGSAVVLWDREDYIREAENQLIWRIILY